MDFGSSAFYLKRIQDEDFKTGQEEKGGGVVRQKFHCTHKPMDRGGKEGDRRVSCRMEEKSLIKLFETF
jgi:hypothetical protein